FSMSTFGCGPGGAELAPGIIGLSWALESAGAMAIASTTARARKILFVMYALESALLTTRGILPISFRWKVVAVKRALTRGFTRPFTFRRRGRIRRRAH